MCSQAKEQKGGKDKHLEEIFTETQNLINQQRRILGLIPKQARESDGKVIRLTDIKQLNNWKKPVFFADNLKFGSGLMPAKRQEDDDRYLLDHDELTGLKNRSFFRRILREWIGRGKPGSILGSILSIDLDGLKTVNDSCGHDAGDGVLFQAGQILISNVRKRDIVARCGGDEFCVLLDRMGLDEAETVAKRIRSELDGFCWLENKFRVTASIGLVQIISEEEQDIDKVLLLADLTLYQAKEKGKNRLAIFDHRMKRGKGSTKDQLVPRTRRCRGG